MSQNNNPEFGHGNDGKLPEHVQDFIVHVLGEDLVRGAEVYLDTGLGEEIDRLAEASSAENYYKGLDDGIASETPHPGQTILSYRMSKAIGDEERAAVAHDYIRDPQSLTSPPHMPTEQS
jgi:hypothetical protein